MYVGVIRYTVFSCLLRLKWCSFTGSVRVCWDSLSSSCFHVGFLWLYLIIFDLMFWAYQSCYVLIDFWIFLDMFWDDQRSSLIFLGCWGDCAQRAPDVGRAPGSGRMDHWRDQKRREKMKALMTAVLSSIHSGDGHNCDVSPSQIIESQKMVSAVKLYVSTLASPLYIYKLAPKSPQPVWTRGSKMPWLRSVK